MVTFLLGIELKGGIFVGFQLEETFKSGQAFYNFSNSTFASTVFYDESNEISWGCAIDLGGGMRTPV